MLTMLLKKYNIESDVASNGQEAVDAVRRDQEQYDMIFMDFTMPVMVRFIIDYNIPYRTVP
jgi:CheY-like chemotaxis protein